MIIDTKKDKEMAKWLNKKALSYEKAFEKTLRLFQLNKVGTKKLVTALTKLKTATDSDLQTLANL